MSIRRDTKIPLSETVKFVYLVSISVRLENANARDRTIDDRDRRPTGRSLIVRPLISVSLSQGTARSATRARAPTNLTTSGRGRARRLTLSSSSRTRESTGRRIRRTRARTKVPILVPGFTSALLAARNLFLVPWKGNPRYLRSRAFPDLVVVTSFPARRHGPFAGSSVALPARPARWSYIPSSPGPASLSLPLARHPDRLHMYTQMCSIVVVVPDGV